MAKKFRNLIQRIVSDDNMRAAYNRTSRAKRMTFGYLEFKEFAEVNLARLAFEIQEGIYKPGPYREFTIYEPKPRLIAALDFRDRVVQHALVGCIGPIFEAGLLPRAFACRVGMGTHAGVKMLQSEMRQLSDHRYFLKTDFSKFFHSIDRATLHGVIRRKISCAATLRLIEAITPETGRGIPIGNLTSQLWANVYGGIMDRHLQCDLREKHWFRYMDDIVVLGRDMSHMRDLKNEVEKFSAEMMGMTLSKWMVGRVDQGVNFLGYRIWPAYKLLRRQSVVRARRKIEKYKKSGDFGALNKFLAAWLGHARWADAHHLLVSLGVEDHHASHY
jgi:hypothetical protein